MRRLTPLIIVTALLLTGCAEKSSAPDAIASYLRAQVAGDTRKLVELSCAAWEAEATTAAAAFQSVNARIEGLSCQQTGKDGEFSLVTCTGTLVIQYRGEDPRQQSLPELTYRAYQEDGTWKMCGTQ